MLGKAMTVGSPKGSPRIAAFPRSLSNIAVSVGGLAVFLILASLLLVSYPIGSTVQGYFSDIDVSNSLVMPVVRRNSSSIDSEHGSSLSEKDSRSGSDLASLVSSSDGDESVNPTRKESSSYRPSVEVVTANSKRAANDVPKTKDENNGMDETGLTSSLNSESEAMLDVYGAVSNTTKTASNDADCDLYHGSWFYDPLGPTYTNNSCPVITQMQNCQGNGRPDKEYENWRWKPSQCDLPRFDAKKFLELMRGKTLAFVGDSVARNQMESMLCLLWQVEVPKNRGNKKMQRYYFRSTSTMIVRIWSSWLVHQSTEALDFAPKGIEKIHLDVPHEVFMDHIATFDVVVISSGHWFAKQSAYVLNNEIVGGQLWWPDQSREMKVNNIEAFGISVETALNAMATHPNYTGITIVRSYSPDHYENGAWNTGGSCTGKIKPLAQGELVANEFTKIMHHKQVAGFDRAFKRAADKSRLKLMDVTEVFGYRHDGHPGPFRSPDPNKLTKRGPDGRPPPQDCLHWCMPGPVDTWNELVLEIIRREFEGRGSSAS